ncbi:MAG: UDP-N-acetylmuramoyl-L-alanyl-D-glutamate--2,6-diaminopimelate ligase [Lachnospiraceae bacterium]|nr:UDP-N-acetylmuramoyl-L-alanyl-D-glutamate--2,6-diaminopimelate ligase [Lachnospiraceae bacterium]
MRLKELIEEAKVTKVTGDENVDIRSLCYDSRKVENGSAFVCIKGAKFDGHDAALEAAKNGAVAIVAEHEIEGLTGVTTVICEDTRYALAFMSAAWFGHPARKLKTIGVTGTKGKTTTTCLVKAVLEHSGRKVGLIGTIETIIGDEHIPAKNTTPESYVLQETFAKMVEAGLDTVVMEVSSQALMQHRCEGFVYDLGIFTNLSPDHIGPDEHSSIEEYIECKAMLFKQCRVGIINKDDSHYEQIIKDHTCSLESFGLSKDCDLRAEDIVLDKKAGHLGVTFKTSGALSMDVKIPTPGRFSVYNALCAIAICRHFDINEDDIKTALLNTQVKGRIEKVKVSDDYTVLIDYAHNAMSLESILTTLKEYDPGRLVCLFGCGGNRAKSRRYEMGEVSGRLADFTIITSDNPRFEEPLDIIADIKIGMAKTDGKYIEIPDRKEAIRYALKNAIRGDIIVLAGKGHEDYQEIKGVKHPMDERVLIAEVIKEENIH